MLTAKITKSFGDPVLHPFLEADRN
jgi:hypothetical protein